MPKFEDSGRSQGKAFIKFATREGIDKAVAKNEEELGGRWLRISEATRREPRNHRE